MRRRAIYVVGLILLSTLVLPLASAQSFLNVAPIGIGGGTWTGYPDPNIQRMIDTDLGTAISVSYNTTGWIYTRTLADQWKIAAIRLYGRTQGAGALEANVATSTDGVNYVWCNWQSLPYAAVGEMYWTTWDMGLAAASYIKLHIRSASGYQYYAAYELEILAAPPLSLSLWATPGADAVELIWSATTGPYTVSRDGLQLTTTLDTSYDDTDYPPGAEVTYTVTDADGGIGTVTVLTVPAAPSVSVLGTTTSTVTLEWTAVETATGYHVYRDQAPIVQVSGSPYVDGNLAPNTDFAYQVAAINGSGEGRPSTVVSARTQEQPPPPSAPQNLHLVNRTSSTLTIAWDPVSGVQGYKIYRNGALAALTTATSALLTDLKPATEYRINVQAYSGSADGELSSALYATTSGRPNSPINLQAQTLGRTCTLTWELDPTGEIPTAYRVYEGALMLYDGADQVFVISDLVPESQHTWFVTAYNDAGESDPAVIDVTMPAGSAPASPSGIFCEPTVRTILVSWNAVYDADWYQVSVGGVPVFEGTAISCRAYGLLPGTLYSVEVRAINEFGPSDPGLAETTTLAGSPSIISLAPYDTGYIVIWTGPSGWDAPDMYQILCDDQPRGETAGLRWEDTHLGWTTGEQHTVTVRGVYGHLTLDDSGIITAYVPSDPVTVPPVVDIVAALLRQWSPLFIVLVALAFVWQTWDFFRGGPYNDL